MLFNVSLIAKVHTVVLQTLPERPNMFLLTSHTSDLCFSY